MILVTGGAGFIGANFVLDWLSACDEPVVNLDKLTYAGNRENLASLAGDPRHIFVQGDIGDTALVSRLLAEHQPRAVVNFAAESHVDRSIHGPEDFIQTNIVGTFRLLESVRAYWAGLPTGEMDCRASLAMTDAASLAATDAVSLGRVDCRASLAMTDASPLAATNAASLAATNDASLGVDAVSLGGVDCRASLAMTDASPLASTNAASLGATNAASFGVDAVSLGGVDCRASLAMTDASPLAMTAAVSLGATNAASFGVDAASLGGVDFRASFAMTDASPLAATNAASLGVTNAASLAATNAASLAVTNAVIASEARQSTFRFLHVSTDEVYGSLAKDEPAFTESHRYEPNSPYSASKAASDHLVRAWHHTHGLPVVTTNCSNNYGPFHFPEKLIPLMIVNALAGKPLPVYGDGMQVRDWLYVKDHCSAIRRVLEAGRLGEVYNVGGWNEKPNIDIVHTVCALLDELRPRSDGQPYATQIAHVKDRPGHDRRYAIDARKIERELGWKPAETFETGIRKTVQWYLDHPDWVAHVQSGAYREWVQTQYA